MPTFNQQQIGTLENINGFMRSLTPTGSMRVMFDPTQLFNETWDSGAIDSINKWVATSGGGGSAPSASTGQGLLNSGVTLNGFSKLTTIKTFKPTEPGYLLAVDRIPLESPILATGHRFWGSGTSNASPTIASPLINAMGWEILTTGQFRPCVYASGTAVIPQTTPALAIAIQQMLDGKTHKYYRWFRGDVGFWAIDDPDNVVAYYLTGAGGPDINGLPLLYQAISNGSTTVTIPINGLALGDTASISGGVLLDNGFTTDNQRPNTDTNTALVNAVAATTTQTGTDQLNVNGRGVIVVLNMATVGTGSVTITIQGKDIVSGQYYTLLAGAAVTTNSVNQYLVYPGATVTANVSANSPLPRTWRVLVTANNANAATYTVGASVIV